MSKHRILSVTEAARNFSDLVNRVFYRGESAILIRNGIPVARLVPPEPSTASAEELARRWETLPHLPPADADRLAEELDEARRNVPPAVPRWE
jgi:prevent-host-death family protein